MELVFLLVALYPVFLLALHVPMAVAYFSLKKRRLLDPRHFIAVSSFILALGHLGAGIPLLGAEAAIPLAAVGIILGVILGIAWWYILVKKVMGAASPKAAIPDLTHATRQ